MKKEKLFFLIPIFIVVLDLFTKKIVKFSFQWGETRKVIGNFLRMTYIENSGVAFGLFGNILPNNPLLKNIIFTIITLSAVAFIIFMIRQAKFQMPKLALFMILGGALGNILERIFGHLFYYGKFQLFYGQVVDFIDLGIGADPSRWIIFGGIFNVADTFVTCGVILLMIYIVFFENKKKKQENHAG